MLSRLNVLNIDCLWKIKCSFNHSIRSDVVSEMFKNNVQHNITATKKQRCKSTFIKQIVSVLDFDC